MKLPIKQFFVLLCLLLMVVSCGKKGPPLPPIVEANFISTPGNVAYTLAGKQVTLTWTHTIDPVKAKIAPEAFDISMAVKELDGCKGCPFIFKSIATVPMPRMSYQKELTPGLNYYFRIQAIGKDGIKSDYSKTLYVNFEK